MNSSTHQKRYVGQTDIQVSQLGFGAAPIGNLYQAVTEDVAKAAVEEALAQGMRYFDTAPYYGFGLSESRLGNALAVSEYATDIVVSSKVGRLLKPRATAGGATEVRHGFADAPNLEPVYDYSYDAVMRSFESSLQRLGRKRIDVLFAHDLGVVTHGDNHPQRFKEFMQGGYVAMQELRSSGAVGAIGLGANEWQICAQALQYGDFDCFLLAGRYTLLDQSAFDTLLPQCAARGVSILLGGPFNSGILASGTKGAGPLYYNYEPAAPEIIARVKQIEAICDAHAVPLAAAALQFPAAHAQVSSVIAGLADAEQVKQACEYARTAIPVDFWNALRQQELIHPDAPTPGSENIF